ncbi:IS1-like element transposase [Thiofilum flexile]|uniref:IS1-like element transposase n=1 Tax=Thiofilum flexile TaxID=125627 RepID=UPI0004755CA7
MACSQTITCPACGSSEVRKAGYNAHDVPRYRCANELCSKKSFMLTYRYKAYELGIKETIVDMALNSSGVRDTARVLGVSKGTVISMIYPRNSRQS